MVRALLSKLSHRFRALFHGQTVDAELNEEIRLHIESETDDLMRALGLPREEARRRAMIAFGGIERYREAQRDARGVRWLEQLAQDVKYAVRSLRKTPGFTLTVIVVLGLGVGANSAMFTLIDRLFFHEPSGVVDPARVFEVYETSPGMYSTGIRPQLIDAVRTDLRGLAAVAASMYAGINRAAGPRVFRVSATYFSLLGVRMMKGRDFTVQEAADSEPLAVVSYHYWQRALGGDTTVVGHSIELARTRYTVIGVAQANFTGLALEPTDIWLPLSHDALALPIIRLAEGTTPGRAEAVMELALRRTFPPRKGFPLPEMSAWPLIPGRQQGWGSSPDVQITLRVVGVAAIILLVAVANIATLLLMRAARRRREIAVRLALGVSRARLCRQLFTEGALLALLAGAAALFVGVWGGAVARAQFFSRHGLTYALIDTRFVLFTLGVAVMGGLVASLAPAVQATRPDLTQALKSGVQEGRSQRSWFRSGLVVAQGAICVILVVGAGLFVQSLKNIHDVPLGIDVNDLLIAGTSFQRVDSTKTYLATLNREAERLAAIPGVQGAAVSLIPPLEGEIGGSFFWPSGDTAFVNGHQSGAGGNAVGPGYFRTVGMRVVDGRDFTSADRAGSASVMIISQSMARELWPGRRAVGQCLVLDDPSRPCTTIVGVVTDANLWSIRTEPPARYYVPITQFSYLRGITIIIRAPGRTQGALVQTVRHDLASTLPVSSTVTVYRLKAAVDPKYWQWEEGSTVFTAMSFLALIIAGVGMYSVVGYAVSQRMHEMGVRVALGARRGQVMGPVILEGLRLAGLGVAVGTGVALMLTPLVASLLYDTSPHDPVAMLAAAVVLLTASVLASWVPARRAARVDPVIALRAE